MADISMCRGVGCDKKDFCYRHTAIPDKYQSMGDFDKNLKDKDCNWFWNNGKKVNI